ncbi:hypothetical protein, partial [Pontiella sp.]|uniref:hypothetical protein n=1 Tax=Pontiella sp. TaxID=2837462 RepID=UPI003562FC11
IDFTDHEIEIRFQDETRWYSLATNEICEWTTRIAGDFYLRAKAKVEDCTVYSLPQSAKVQFPTREEILSDAGITNAMEEAWQQTLEASTTNSYREFGFMIYLNTADGTYSANTSVYTASTGVPGSQVQGTFWFNWENSDELSPLSSGANYPVALFHTHPPFTFADPLVYESRDTGASTGTDEDVDMANKNGLPGFLYDYSAPVLYPGHLEEDDYNRYDYGPSRRILP